MAKLLKPIQFIRSDEIRGKGVEENPMRRVEQYFTINGTLVFEYDPYKDEISMTINMLTELRKLDGLTEEK